MGGDICFAIGFILEKFENIQDVLKTRNLNSEKMASYSAPLVNYLQYNLNIFFDKLNNELDPLNNIIYYIWLECLAIIRYSAIGDLEYKSRSSNYEHVNSYPFLEKTRLHLTSDNLYSISSPGRVFKGKINERQIKYLTYVIEVLKELFNCGGSGIPYEKLEQKEFKEIKSILGHYPCDNRKLKVIYNHYMEREFSLYDYVWILNLLVAKGSSRFIRVKEYEMKVKLEKKLKGLNKKYESSVSVHENHKRITSSSNGSNTNTNSNDAQKPMEAIEELKMPDDLKLYAECIDDDDLESNVSGNSSYRLSLNRASINNMTDDRDMPGYSSESAKLIPYDSKISSTSDGSVYDSNKTLNNDSNVIVKSNINNKISKPSEGRISIFNSRLELMNGNIGRYNNNSSSSSSSISNNSSNNRLMVNNMMMSNSNRNLMMMNRNSNRNLMIMNHNNNNSHRNLMMMNSRNSNRNLMMMSRSSIVNIDMDRDGNLRANNIYVKESSSFISQYDDYGVGYGNNNGNNYGNGNGNGNGNKNKNSNKNTNKISIKDKIKNKIRNKNKNKERYVDIDDNIDSQYRYNRENYQNRDGNGRNRQEDDSVKIITCSNSYYLLSNQTLNGSSSNRNGNNQDEYLREMVENLERNSRTNLDDLLNSRYSFNTFNTDGNDSSFFLKYNNINHHIDSRKTLVENNDNNENDNTDANTKTNSYLIDSTNGKAKIINDVIKNDGNLDSVVKNSNANINDYSQKLPPLVLSNAQDRKVI